MKNVRFSQVVQKAGKPSVHLQLVEAGSDRELKQAARANRVMTVNQSTVGHSADYGLVGLDGEVEGQILIFPKSLARFEGKRVVGIKYDLLEEPVIPKSALAPKTSRKKAAKKVVPDSRKKLERLSSELAELHLKEEEVETPTPQRMSGASHSQKSASSRPRSTQQRIVVGIKKAIRALEDGQSVKAYNLLKELLPEKE